MKRDDSYRQYKIVLRKYVLNKANIAVVSPGDCKSISAAIEKSTGKIISETTLKRFFGFARQEFNLSAFTLNALSEFAGFKGWEDFCRAVMLSDGSVESSFRWERCRNMALKITCMTQKMLINLSGVPFANTVSRTVNEQDFSYFLESRYQLFCLTGAPGMGKSVQVAHLVKKFFLDEHAPYKESIILLIKPGTPKDLTSYLNLEPASDKIEIDQELKFLEYFYQHQDEVKGKVVIMLDGVDDFLHHSELTDMVFRRITELLSYFKGIAWLKVVLSLRPATWKLIKRQIDDSAYLRQTWFTGFYYQRELKSNLMPLNEKEVRQAMKAIQDDMHVTLTWSNPLTLLFGVPYFINLCYQHLKKKPYAVLRGNTMFCNLVSSFISQKIDRSPYAAEKNKIIKRFIESIDYGISNNQVEKIKLLTSGDEISVAYKELIAEGVLLEKESDKILSYHNYVLFIHEPIMNYLIARELFSNNENAINIINNIISDYRGNQQRKVLLKWILWHQLLKKKETMPDIFSMPLSPDEKGELLIFVCDLLEENPGMLSEEEKSRFTGDTVSFMVKHFLSLNRLDADYDEAFLTLLKHTTDPLYEANLSIFIAVLALVRFDSDMLFRALNRMKQLDDKIWSEYYPFNPLESLIFIAEYYMARQPDYRILDEIEHFIQSECIICKEAKVSDEIMIAYQLASFALMLCRPPMEVIEFTAAIKRNVAGVYSHMHFNIIIPYIEAFAYLQCAMKRKANQILAELETFHPFSYHQKEYSHAALLVEMIKAEADVLEGQGDQATRRFLKIYCACKESGFVLLQVYAILYLLKVYKEQNEFDKAYSILDHARKTLSYSHFPIEELILKRIKEEV